MRPRLTLINGEWFCIGAVAVARGATMHEAHSRWYAMRIFA
jgi:hypothetical protein